MSDADLLTCLDAVLDRYVAAEDAAPCLPSLSENREALRLFASLGDADLREAVLSLLRVLAWQEHAPAASAPSGQLRPAANRPG